MSLVSLFGVMSGFRNISCKRLLPVCLGLVLTPWCAAQAPIGDIVTSDASVKGDMVLTGSGTRVASGSSVTAGQNPALLRLARGGEIRICPRSKVSLTNSQSGRDLVVGMGTGAIEAQYAIRATADTVLTPDFRILLAGPANFHFAIGADARGNTCVRSLDGNTGSILVTEMMGDGVYQVLPGEQVYLKNGSVANAIRTVPPDCGCPQTVAVMTAQTPEAPAAPPQPQSIPQQAPTPSSQEAQKVELPANSPEAILAEHGTPVAASPQTSETTVNSPSGEIHVQIDAPFVYDAREAAAPPPPIVARLTLGAMPEAISETQVALPPGANAIAQRAQVTQRNPALPKPQRKGFFGHVRSFFAAIFK